MAVVKILRNRNVVALEQYIFDGRSPDDPLEFGGCLEGSIADQFISTQYLHGCEVGVEAIHIIQSWNTEESSLLPPEEFAGIGKKMVEDMFPGHEFCVATHTDTDKVHNHIVVNPVRSEDGRRIQNKLRLLEDIRAISDRLCVESGLSVVETQSRETWLRTPQNVREMKKRGGFSWILDLKEKAKFARSISTTFDEYAGILNQFGIQVRAEAKNVIYHYPGKRAKRGDSPGLGQKYDRKGLIENFRANYQRLFDAGLKSKSISEINFLDHWKFHRGGGEYFVPEYRYKELALPTSVFKALKNVDLETSAHSLGLELVDIDGRKHLKGREHIVIDGHRWSNLKSGAHGGPIEMLAYLSGENFLQALGRFDTSGRVTELSKICRQESPSYRAFYVPSEIKRLKLSSPDSGARLFWLSAFAIQHLSRKKMVWFAGDRRIKIHSSRNQKASITLHKTGDAWVCRKGSGVSGSMVVGRNMRSAPTLIFQDPIAFLKSGKFVESVLRDQLQFNVVVPMKPLRTFLKDDLRKIRGAGATTVVGSKNHLRWGRRDKETALSEREVSELAASHGLAYRSIDELLRELILGRFNQGGL